VLALAGLALRLLFADGVLQAARFGAPHLKALLDHDAVTLRGLATGTAVEAGLTFLVTCAAFATLIDRRGPRLGGVAVGLAQAAVILVGFRLTGGAANPARWFGPAFWQLTLPGTVLPGPLADHTVYWVGPAVGALVGGIFYSAVILPAGPEKGVVAPPARRPGATVKH
jgi:glycerol uptake facilitator-like aquaporin